MKVIVIGDMVLVREVESDTTQVFQKIGLEPSIDMHRRVLAVLTYLRVNN